MNRDNQGKALLVALAVLTGLLASACGDDLSAVARIGVEELSTALQAGTAVVVDVRTQTEYEQGHVEGALHIPANEIASRQSELPHDKKVVLYCS